MQQYLIETYFYKSAGPRVINHLEDVSNYGDTKTTSLCAKSSAFFHVNSCVKKISCGDGSLAKVNCVDDERVSMVGPYSFHREELRHMFYDGRCIPSTSNEQVEDLVHFSSGGCKGTQRQESVSKKSVRSHGGNKDIYLVNSMLGLKNIKSFMLLGISAKTRSVKWKTGGTMKGCGASKLEVQREFSDGSSVGGDPGCSPSAGIHSGVPLCTIMERGLEELE